MRSPTGPRRWRVRSQVTGWDGLRHCVAGCTDLFARCVQGKESLESWSRRNNYDWTQAVAVWRMVSQVKVPSIDRRAAILMRDWGLEDEDISEMLAMPEDRVAWVRANQDEVRAREVIPFNLEMAVAQIDPEDPPPEELYARARSLRESRSRNFNAAVGDFHKADVRTAGIRAYAWRQGTCAFIPTST